MVVWGQQAGRGSPQRWPRCLCETGKLSAGSGSVRARTGGVTWRWFQIWVQREGRLPSDSDVGRKLMMKGCCPCPATWLCPEVKEGLSQGFARWLQQKGGFKCLVEATCRVMSPEVGKGRWAGERRGGGQTRQELWVSAPWDGIGAGEHIERFR